MIPRESARGRSFVGCSRYYLADPGADTTERVGFTQVLNMRGVEDPEKAFRFMAFTTMAANEEKDRTGARGRRIERPVWSQSFSWNPEQEPTREEMIGAAQSWMGAFGVSDHQAVIVQHTDRPHPHIHLILNLYNPHSKKVAELGWSKLKSSAWAEEYEREHGGKIYCKQREKNNERRAQGEYVKYQEPEFDLKARVTQIYHASDSGAAFQAGMEQSGLRIADGGKRIVIIDAKGEVHSLSRQIDGAKSKQIKVKLGDLQLPRAADVLALKAPEQRPQVDDNLREEAERENAKQNAGRQEEEYHDRDAYDQEWSDSIIAAAIEAEAANIARGGQPDEPRQVPAVAEPSSKDLAALQERHAEQLQLFATESNNRRRSLAAQIEAEHGQRERTLQRESGRLDMLLRNSGPVRRWWLRLTGQLPKNASEQLVGMRAELANIGALKEAARKSLETELSRQKADIESRQNDALRAPAKGQTTAIDERRRAPDQTQEPPDFDEEFGPSPGW